MPTHLPERTIGWRWKFGSITALLLTLAAWGGEPPVSGSGAAPTAPAAHRPERPPHPLLSFKFTNELAQAVSLDQFRGQALALTFIFTRCPNPNYCPRLSRNFQDACRILSTKPGSPTNWHFLSVTMDPDFDSPAVLKAYAHLYQYNPAHWSFLTGPNDKIRELAALSDAQFQPEDGSLNHNFRTLVIDTRGDLQMVFPVTGDFAAALADEILKAASVPPVSKPR